MKRLRCLTILLFLVGCSTPSRTWEGVDRSTVWTAMIAVAESPEYKAVDPKKRWVVAQNDVAVHAETGQIEIHRILRRTLVLPRQREQHDTRDLFLEITLSTTSPPTTMFKELSMQLIPVRTIEEADLYFDQVENLLSRP